MWQLFIGVRKTCKLGRKLIVAGGVTFYGDGETLIEEWDAAFNMWRLRKGKSLEMPHTETSAVVDAGFVKAIAPKCFSNQGN